MFRGVVDEEAFKMAGRPNFHEDYVIFYHWFNYVDSNGCEIKPNAELIRTLYDTDFWGGCNG